MALKFRRKKKSKISLKTILIGAGFLAFVILYWPAISELPDFIMQMVLAAIYLPLGVPFQFTVTPEAIHSILMLVYHFIIAVLFLVFSLWFVSQFLLPVRTFDERTKVFKRILIYLFGRHGPAVFVREGKIESEENEIKKRGPGVAFIDPCSALVLQDFQSTYRMRPVELLGKRRSDSPIHAKAAGPGLYFINDDVYRPEEIVDSVDLRKQVRIKAGVHAYTRDGIELKALILTVFTLGQPPDTLQVGFVRRLKPGQSTPVDPWADLSWQDLRVLRFEERTVTDASGRTHKVKTIRSAADDLDEQDKKEIFQRYRNLLPKGAENAAGMNGRSAPFNFNAERAIGAVYSAARTPDTGELDKWEEIPGDIATQIFRNLLSEKTYDELFFSIPGSDSFPLAEFKNQFARQVRAQGVMNFQFVSPADSVGFLLQEPGQAQPPEPEPPASQDEEELAEDIDLENSDLTEQTAAANEPEPASPASAELFWDENDLIFSEVTPFQWRKVLRERGIKVIHASFIKPEPVSEKVREQYLNTWRANWEKRTKLIRAEYDLQAMRIRNIARARAQQEMTASLARIFETSPHSQEALAMRVFQAMEAAAADPEIRKQLPGSMMNLLMGLRRWLNIDWDEDGNKPPSVVDVNQPPAPPEAAPAAPAEGEVQPGSGEETQAQP